MHLKGISAKILMEISLEMRIRSSTRNRVTLIRLETFSSEYKMLMEHPEVSVGKDSMSLLYL